MFGVLLACSLYAVEPAPPGPYRVGVTTFLVEDAEQKVRLVTEVWYPTESSQLPVVPYASGVPTIAMRNAPPAKGPFPWIAFSHGLSAVREQSTFLTEYLASHGYVVAAPDHPGNNGRDFRLMNIYQSALQRPRELRKVIDAMAARNANPKDQFYGKLDKQRLAAVGHSFGGYTALALGGARAKTGRLPPAANGVERPAFVDFSDPRVKAIAALAPVTEQMFDADSFRCVRVPLLIVGAEHDGITPFNEHQLPIFEYAAGPRYIAKIGGSTHFSFANDELLRHAPFFVRALHRPTVVRSDFDAIVRRMTLEFLQGYLFDDDGARAELAATPNVDMRYAPPMIEPVEKGANP